MNCGKMQRWMLLAQTGELSQRRTTRLQAHLADCSICRREQTLRGRLCAAARSDAEPSPLVTQRILAEARSRLAARQSPGTPWLIPSGIAALAASVVLIAGAWFHTHRAAPHDAVGEMQALVALLTNENATEPGTTDAAHPGEDTFRSLGRKLLELEELSADDSHAPGLSDEEVRELLRPDPTAVLPRSKRASAAGRYG